jgi:monothiol glutaredoxin
MESFHNTKQSAQKQLEYAASDFREWIMEIFDTIKQQVESNAVLIYMKGSPDQPQCGFSAQATQALMACGEKFAYIDILSNPEIRANLPQYSEWPTFPQLFVDGELVGGCDIIIEMYQSGELQPLVKAATVKSEA